MKINNENIVQRIRDVFRSKKPNGPNGPNGPNAVNPVSYFFKRDELIKEINAVKTHPIEQIYYALTYLINNKHEYLVDAYGRLGNLVNKNEYYLFQPVEITDERATIYERMIPVDSKNTAVTIDLNKMRGVVDTAVDNTHDRTFETIVSEFEGFLQTIEPVNNAETTNTRNNWYKTLAVISNHIQSEFGITYSNIRKLCIHHMIDELSMKDKKTLLNTMFSEWSPVNEFESTMKEYFEDKMVAATNGDIGIVWSEDDSGTDIYVQSEDEEDGWIKAGMSASNSLIQSKDYSEKYILKKTKLNDVVGFMAKLDDEFVFKTRDLKDSVNKKGARVSQALNVDIISKINHILGKPFYTLENVKTYFGEGKIKLVVVSEILFRAFQNVHKNGKIWFLSNEQMMINKISDFTRKK
jgi:hypothetical protein